MDEIYSFKIKNDGESLASQVCSFMKNLVVSGVLKDGEKIPNESELSEIFKVSRMTVREAILNLVHQDLLHRHVGRGTFVKTRNMIPKILWVCGKDITKGDISPYYSNAVRLFAEECGKYGYQAVPAWIASDNSPAITAYLPPRNNDYAGYCFLSTDFSHPLLRAAAEKKLPYVHITGTPAHSRFVTPDIEQGVLLGIDYLKMKNPEAKKVIILCNRIYEERIKQITSSRPNLNARIIGLNTSPFMSEAIAESCEVMNTIIRTEDDWSSLFIFDDVMALGVSEAILKSRTDKIKNIHLLVTGGGSLQIPFSRPVTYLFYDIATEVGNAARILHEQISGLNPDPGGCFGKFSLADSDFISKKVGIQQKK